MQEYKEIEISELNLPPRIYIHLKKGNIRTVDDLKNCDITAFNFSEREIKEIRYQLKQFGITLPEQPEPQPTIIQSEEHIKAVALHQKILISAELAQKNLWDMCTSLKEMRDSKLYKELGYSNFEDYCENEVGMTRVNAYRYITVVEKVKLENVTSMLQIGMTKLSLLATISQEQQAEISQRVDLENTTVKQLKEEIENLKREVEIEKFNYQTANGNYECLAKVNRKLQKQIKELESRPVEVAVLEPEPSANERLLQETIKNLQIESQKRDEELERQYREDEKAVRQMLEKQKQDALQQLTDEYEEKIRNLSAENSVSDVNVSLEVAEALISTATKIVRQIRGLALNDDENIYQYSSKLKNLIYAIEKNINDMERLSQ